MCPMCEKRAQLLLQQQQLQAAAGAVDGHTGKPAAAGIPPKSSGSLFRNPFKSCKNFTHQCCSPVCESQRTSIHSVRRSSVRPSLTPDHSGEITPDEYRILESPFTPDPKEPPGDAKPHEHVLRKPRSFLTRLKLLTQGPAAAALQGESGDKVSDAAVVPSPTVIVAETPTSEGGSAMNMTETNVSESTMVSMRNLNGSSFRGSTLKSSAYDDDASTFAIIPRTSMNSQDWTSDASGLSDRFGELDIGYLSLEESGEGPDIDDTVSISSSQCEDLDPTDTVSESDLEQDYSINTDSQEWCTDDTASVLHWSRGHISKNHLHLHLPDLETTPPHELTASPPHRLSLPRQNSLAPETVEVDAPEPTETTSSSSASAASATLHCSRCGRKENKQTAKKQNPFLDGEMAAKVVMLLGKYGNRRGLRVAGLPVPAPPQAPELDRLRSMLSPNSSAVSAFQNEVARMMLEGVDVPGLNMDVEQFLAGYMKLNSPFYIDLIEDFFKSVCVDCFGHMEEVRGSDRQRPAYTVLKPKRPAGSSKSFSSSGKRS